MRNLYLKNIFFVLCLVFFIKCKNEEENKKEESNTSNKKALDADQAIDKSLQSTKESQELIEKGRAINNPTVLKDNPFINSTNSLYSFSREQLLSVPSGDLLKEIQKLRSRNSAEKEELERNQTFNDLMCERLQELENECVARKYVSSINAANDWSCRQDVSFEEDDENKNQIRISFLKGDGSYRLIIDEEYVSNIVSKTQPVVTFNRFDGNNSIKSKKWGEISSLQITKVSPQSQIQGRGITGTLEFLSSDVSLKITIDGILLLKDFSLVDSVTPSKTTYRINPSELSSLGNHPNCSVSETEIIELQKRAVMTK